MSRVSLGGCIVYPKQAGTVYGSIPYTGISSTRKLVSAANLQLLAPRGDFLANRLCIH